MNPDPAGPFRFRHRAMNTEFEILAYGPSEALVERIAEAAFADVDRLEDAFSYYLERSELARMNREAAEREVAIDADLAAVLEASRILCEATGGAFDPSVGPLMKCWRFHDGQGSVPAPDALAAARARTGFRHVQLDVKRRTVRYDVPGLEIDLGGIGKGYAVDAAVARLRSFRINRAMVHGGTSSAYAIGAPPGLPGWPFRLRPPDDPSGDFGEIVLRERAISGSATADERVFEADGRRYGHELDPRTGRPAQGNAAAWALAPTATESDALSTAFIVFSPEETRAYCEANPGIQAAVLPEGAEEVTWYGRAE